VADKEIKSTLEIAMEKIAKLPKLTPEEIREQREKELGPRGKAIANRYLEGTLKETDLETEISLFQEEERDIVRRSLNASLCNAIDLENREQSCRSLSALQVLQQDAGLEEKTRELEKIFTDYLRQQEEGLTELERQERESLRALGISGSAVRPNPEASPESQEKLQVLQQRFRARIEDLRRELLRSVTTSSGS
jgi:hypothetical protein